MSAVSPGWLPFLLFLFNSAKQFNQKHWLIAAEWRKERKNGPAHIEIHEVCFLFSFLSGLWAQQRQWLRQKERTKRKTNKWMEMKGRKWMESTNPTKNEQWSGVNLLGGKELWVVWVVLMEWGANELTRGGKSINSFIFCWPAVRHQKDELSWMEGCGLLSSIAGLWAAAPLAAAEFHSMNSIKFIPFHPSRPFLSCCFRFLYECSPFLFFCWISEVNNEAKRWNEWGELGWKPITVYSVIWILWIQWRRQLSISLHSIICFIQKKT